MSWVESTFNLSLTPFQRAAVEVLCRACGCGPYNMGNTFKNAEWNFGYGVSFQVERRHFATTDSNGLTTLVIAAHEEAMRVEISSATFTHLTITFHPRERPGDFSKRHPTIEEAVARYRKDYPRPLRAVDAGVQLIGTS
jgi:hypothetical protein